VRGLRSARTTCGDLNVALVVYHLVETINRLLKVWPFHRCDPRMVNADAPARLIPNRRSR
jgi:hypothetical protein